MTDLKKVTNELVNALDIIQGNKAFDRKLVIETALKKYADSDVIKNEMAECPSCRGKKRFYSEISGFINCTICNGTGQIVL